MKQHSLIVVVCIALTGCESSEPRAGGDAAVGNQADASMVPIMVPTWQLEDIQPASPRVGQTYGLDTFTGRIIVVSLLEGF